MVTNSHTHENLNTLASITSDKIVHLADIQEVKTCDDAELTTLDAKVDTMIFSKTK